MKNWLHTYVVHYPRVVWYMRVRPWLYRSYTSFLHRNRASDCELAASSIPDRLNITHDELTQLRFDLVENIGQDRIVEQSQQAQQHLFPILQEENLDFSQPFRWHTDPKTQFAWPRETRYNNIAFASPPKGTDVKRLWDAARMHWLQWMCCEFVCTGDINLRDRIVAELLHFVEENPTGTGIHWSMPMEVGIRAHNIIVVLALLQFDIRTEEKSAILHALYDHMVYLVHHLEFTRHPGNHLDGNLLGLASLGLLFSNTSIGKKAQQLAQQHVRRELNRQLYSDGVNWEKSTSYHRLVVELLSLTLWYLPGGRTLPEAAVLHQARKYLKATQTSTGNSPLFGDADDGRVFRTLLDCAYDELFSGVCAVDLNNVKCLGELIAFATQPLTKQDWPKSLTVEEFPYGGYVVARSSQHHFMMDVGSYGMDGWGGHGHNDWGAFTLTAFGVPVLIDSGTGCYTEDPQLRDSLRRTSAHNTIELNHMEQVEFAGMWRIRDETGMYTHDVSQTHDGIIVSATMHEYERRCNAIVTRTVTLNESSQQLELTVHDVLSGLTPAKLYFHFDAAVQMSELKDNTLELTSADVRIVITSEAPMRLEEARHSPSYGVVHTHPVVCIDFAQTKHVTRITIAPSENSR